MARERRQATEPTKPTVVEDAANDAKPTTTVAAETTAAETTAAKADEATKADDHKDHDHEKDDHSSAAVAGATACLLTTLFSL